MVLQPEAELWTPQAVPWRAVNTPFAQCIASQSCSYLQPQHALWHVVVHARDFGMRLVRVGHQVQLDDACPLNVLIWELMARCLVAKLWSGLADTG